MSATGDKALLNQLILLLLSISDVSSLRYQYQKKVASHAALHPLLYKVNIDTYCVILGCDRLLYLPKSFT